MKAVERWFHQTFERIPLEPNNQIQLLNPVHGLSKRGDYWGQTLQKHIKIALCMKYCTSHVMLILKPIGKNCLGHVYVRVAVLFIHRVRYFPKTPGESRAKTEGQM